MTTIFLVRHGRSTWNEVGRIQGKQDPPLSDWGRRQAEALAQTFQHWALDAIYSSPQQRARLTADAVAAHHNVPVTLIQGLAEIDHGDWEGLTEPEVQRRFAPSFEMWLTQPSQTQMPGGEHCLSLQQRVLEAWQEITAREAGNRALIISHEIPIKVIVADILGLNLDQIGRFVVGNATITLFEQVGKQFQLVQLNNRCHLSELRAKD